MPSNRVSTKLEKCCEDHEETVLANTPEGRLLTLVQRDMSRTGLEVAACETCGLINAKLLMKVTQEAMRRFAAKELAQWMEDFHNCSPEAGCTECNLMRARIAELRGVNRG